MHSLFIISCAVLLYPSVQGIFFRKFPGEPVRKYYGFDYTSEDLQNNTLNIVNDSSEIKNNVSVNQPEEQRVESNPNMLAGEATGTDESNSTIISSSPLPSNQNTQSSQVEITLTEIFGNESISTNSVTQYSGSPSTTGQRQSSIRTTSLGTSTGEGALESSTEVEEQEGVVRGKPTSTETTNTTTSKAETIYQKALALINDTYTLSILIPVSAGVVFASTILVTIATCKCLRRQCRRRRLRKKTLPDSVKHLRPSDRARLLAESSDEEF